MLTGGDTLHRYPPSDLPFLLVNNYGPTECTVVATSGPVLPDGSRTCPLHWAPHHQTQIYLLDEHLQPVPPGSAGEIYIGGAGVARGYRNLPELTAEKFISYPSARTEQADSTRPATWPASFPMVASFSWAAPTTRSRSAAIGSSRAKFPLCSIATRTFVKAWLLRARTLPGISGWWRTSWLMRIMVSPTASLREFLRDSLAGVHASGGVRPAGCLAADAQR